MWTNDAVVEATGGTAAGGGWTAYGVSIDSRNVKPGQLFVALKGDRFDGHDYVQEALAKGAAALLLHREVSGVPEDVPRVMVDDTGKALNDLAVFARRRTQAKVIAITGSVGKTGTKEALAQALKPSGEVYASYGNYNNHIGLPLSMANLPPQAKFAVFELGMNHPGEISYLTRLVVPDIAIITTIESVHLEFFPSVEAIADAKAEIFESMGANGVAILNCDNPYYTQLKRRAEHHGIGRMLSFGMSEDADARMVSYRMMELGSEIEAIVNGTPLIYRMGSLGRHWGTISTAVLLAASVLGCDLAVSAESLALFHEPEGRGRLCRIPWRAGYLTLIDDSYNASPAAMMTGFAKLRDLHEGLGGSGRKVAILGDMLELGMAARELHTGLLSGVDENGIDKVYAVGSLMRCLYDALPEEKRGWHAQQVQELIPMMADLLQEGDVVLVKGSHGSRMYELAKALKEGNDGSVGAACAGRMAHAV